MSFLRSCLFFLAPVVSGLLATPASALTVTYNAGEQWGTSYVTPPSLDFVVTSYTAWLVGGISGSGNVSLLGPGSLVLSGSNTYSGTTTVTAGTLQFAKTISLYGSDSAQWTKLRVQSGAAAAFNAGGTGEFTSANLAALSTASGVFSAGSSLAIDTSTATSYVFTQSHNISAANFGVAKAGLGTLVLSGSNNFAGGFTIGENRVLAPFGYVYGGTNDSSRVVLSSAGALGTTGTITFQGGSLQFTAANTTDYSARFSQASGQYFNFDTNGRNVTFATGLNAGSVGRLTKTGSGTLTLSGTNTPGQVGVQGGTLQIGAGAVLNSTGNAARIIEVIDGTLLINGGTVNSSRAFVGSTGMLQYDSGNGIDWGYVPTGTLSASATMNTGLWNVYELGIGTYGKTGTVSVTGGTLAGAFVYVGGANFNNLGGAGTFNLSGTGVATADTFGVGWTNSSGTANISGGRLTVAGDLWLGTSQGSSTSAVMNLSSGTVSAHTIRVGAQTSGTLNVSGGVLNSSSFLYVGTDGVQLQSGDHGVVNLSSGTINASVIVRRAATDGVGTLNVSGGVLNAPTLWVSSRGADPALFNLSGGLVNATYFTLNGEVGGSTATISGGTMSVSNSFTVGGVGNGYASTLNMTGGSLTVAQLNAGVYGQYNLSGGTFAVAAANTNLAGTMQISGSAVVTLGSGTGTLDIGSFYGGELILGGDAVSGATAAGMLNVGTVTAGSYSNGVTFNQTGTYTFAPNLVGSTLNVFKNGSGTTILTGSNNYGFTTLVAGTLGLGSNDALGSGPVSIFGGGLRAVNSERTVSNSIDAYGSFTLGRLTNLAGTILLRNDITITSANPDASPSSASTISGVISGSRSLTFADGINPTGVIILTGNNAYTGGTVLQSGTLQIGNSGTIGSVVGNIVDNASLVFKRSDNFTQSGAISGTGTVTQAGGGVLTLTGSNSYSGGTFVNGGKVYFASDANLGALSSALTLNSGTLHNTTALVSGRQIVLGANGGTIELGNGFLTLTSAISGSGSLTKTAGNILTLTGAQTYAGATSVQGGLFKVEAGSLASSSVNVSSGAAFTFVTDGSFGGAITGSGTFSRGGSGVTVYTGTASHTGGTIVESGTLQIGNGGTAGTISGTLRIDAGSTLAFNRSDFVTIANTITGSGSILQSGSGATILTGSNSYTGNTVISAGILAIGTGGTNGNLGTGNVINNSLLAVSRLDSITLANVISGNGAVEKTAGGTLTLTGSNSYTGGTRVFGGQVDFANDANLGALSGAVTLNGGTLHNTTDLVSSRQIVLGANGGTIALGSGFLTLTTAVSGSGSLTKTAGNILTLTGAQTYTGSTSVQGGSLKVEAGSLASSAVNVASGATLNFTNDGSFGGVLTGSGTFSRGGTGATVLTGTASHTGGTVVESGTLQFGNGGAAGAFTGTGAFLDNGALVFNSRSASTLGGVISGTGSLAVSGSHTLTLTGSNTYSGQTTITSGILSLGVGGTNGTLGSGMVVNNGLLAINRSDALTVANTISGSGTLQKTAGGTLTLTGSNSYTGGTQIFGGQVDFANDANLGALSGAVTLNGGTLHNTTDLVTARQIVLGAGGGTLALGNGFLSLSTAISGSGGLTKTAGNILTLTGAQTYTGPTNVLGGLLKVDAGSLASSSVNVASGATFLFDNGGAYGGSITGSGTFSRSGAGTTVFTGTASHTGGTLVQSGMLQIGSGGTAGAISGTLRADAGSTIAFNRSDTVTASNIITGAGSVWQSGPGTTVLTGSNSYAGGTVINAGMLGIGSNFALGSGQIVINGGGIRAVDAARTVTNTLALNGSFILGRFTNFSGSAVLGTDITITSANPDVSAPATSTFSGVISGAHGITFDTGANPIGRIILSATNTYTGDTVIGEGALAVNGSIAGRAIVKDGALLGGTGRVNGAVIVESGGTLSPANSFGQFTLANSLTMEDGSVLVMEFGSPTVYDQLDVQGLFTAGGTLSLVVVGDFLLAEGSSFTIFNGATPGFNSGSFTITSNLEDGLKWDTSALQSSGIVTVIPEPSTVALLVLSGAALWSRRRRP